MSALSVTWFLVGALSSSVLCLALVWRQARLDHRIIRHVRRNAYLRGWQDARNETWDDSGS